MLLNDHWGDDSFESRSTYSEEKQNREINQTVFSLITPEMDHLHKNLMYQADELFHSI